MAPDTAIRIAAGAAVGLLAGLVANLGHLGVEWSLPACAQWPHDVKPAFGFPVPFAQASLASSTQYELVPHLLVFDVLCVGVLVAVAYLLCARYAPISKAIHALVCAGMLAAATLLLTVVLVQVAQRDLLLSQALHANLWNYRPVAVVQGWHGHCAPLSRVGGDRERSPG